MSRGLAASIQWDTGRYVWIPGDPLVTPGAALPYYSCEPDTHGKLSMITKGSVPQE